MGGTWAWPGGGGVGPASSDSGGFEVQPERHGTAPEGGGSDGYALMAAAGGGAGGYRNGGARRGAVARAGQVLEVVPGLEDVIARRSPAPSVRCRK